MKRYYLSKIFQDTTGEFGMPGAWMHRLQTYTGIDYQGGEIKVDPTTGVPTEKALLVLVGGIDHKQFQDDDNLVPMPVIALDQKISSVATAAKLEAKDKIESLGFGATAVNEVWGNADSMRNVLDHYGQLNNAEFDCNLFDIDES